MLPYTDWQFPKLGDRVKPNRKPRTAIQIGFDAARAETALGTKRTFACGVSDLPWDTRACKKSLGTDVKDIGTPKQIREMYHWLWQIDEQFGKALLSETFNCIGIVASTGFGYCQIPAIGRGDCGQHFAIGGSKQDCDSAIQGDT